MSFAYDVKAELCKVPINRSCCAVAEGCGVLLYASAFTANEVRIVTENDEFAARLPKLFQKAFSLRFDELPDKSKDGGKLVFRITQGGQARHDLARARLRSPGAFCAAPELCAP